MILLALAFFDWLATRRYAHRQRSSMARNGSRSSARPFAGETLFAMATRRNRGRMGPENRTDRQASRYRRFDDLKPMSQPSGMSRLVRTRVNPFRIPVYRNFLNSPKKMVWLPDAGLNARPAHRPGEDLVKAPNDGPEGHQVDGNAPHLDHGVYRWGLALAAVLDDTYHDRCPSISCLKSSPMKA